MNTTEALKIAGVPENLYKEAEASLQLASERIKGVLSHKMRARWFKAGMIAEQLAWEHNRLIEARPDLAKYDVAPMLNITCNGDFVDWELQDIKGVMRGRPNPNCWLNPDPESAEYKRACEINEKYFGGLHPRTQEARKMWYRRNAGEYLVYDRGVPISAHEGFEIWRGVEGDTTVTAWRASGHWIINTSKRWFGKVFLNSRKGFEIDNVFCGKLSPQMWFPIPGYQLRAPVSYSTMPGKVSQLSYYVWERPEPNGINKTYSLNHLQNE